jgi:hypothetical protein
LEVKIAEEQKLLNAFKKEHSETTIGSISVGSVLGGMRGMMGMVY